MAAGSLCGQLVRRGRVLPRRCQDLLLLRRLHGDHRTRVTAAGRRDGEEEEAAADADARVLAAAVAAAVRPQSARYGAASSSRVRRSALSQASVDGCPPRAPGRRGDATAPDDGDAYRPDPRAFQRCRPEYASMTLDLSRRPAPGQALALLQEAAGVTELLLPEEAEPAPAAAAGDARLLALLRQAAANAGRLRPAQLLRLLESLVWLDAAAAAAASGALAALESELARHADQMSVGQLLLAGDLWRCLGRPAPQLLRLLRPLFGAAEPRRLGAAQLVQLLYLAGEGRHCPPELAAAAEAALTRHLDDLRPEELGAVCLALFKSQTALSQSCVAGLVDRAAAAAAALSDFAVVNVFKLLRFSHLDHKAWLEAMGREVPRRVPGMGVMSMMHVALACSALHYRSDAILAAVAARTPAVAPRCRSKDACKLLWSFGALGVPPDRVPGLYECLLDAMRRRKAEFQRYPEHLLTGLLGLAFVGRFPEDLVELALSPEFVRLALESPRLELSKDLLTLDGSVGLEVPRWGGPRLDPRTRDQAAARLWTMAQSDICRKPEVLEAERRLRDLLGGGRFVRKGMILPHTRSVDLEVHLGPDGSPLPVDPGPETADVVVVGPEESSPAAAAARESWLAMLEVRLTEDLLAQMLPSRRSTEASSAPRRPVAHGGAGPTRSQTAGPGRRALTDGPREPSGPRVKLAVQVTNRNHYCYQSEQLMGLHALKRRQLLLAGYRVVELSHWEWFPLLRRRQAEKLAYLHCKLYGVGH